MVKAQVQRAAVIGVAEHGNSAVLVTVASGGELLDRRRVDLTRRSRPELAGDFRSGRTLKEDHPPSRARDLA